MRPASIFDRSRMSLISPSRCLPAPWIFSRSAIAGLVAAVGRVFDQDFAVADDGVERRAQLVAHVGEERRLGARRRLGLGPARLGLLLGGADLAGILAEHRQACGSCRRVRRARRRESAPTARRWRSPACCRDSSVNRADHVAQHEQPDDQDRQDQARERDQDEPPPALGDLVHRPVGGLAGFGFSLLDHGLDLVAQAGARLLQRVLERIDLLNGSQFRFAGADQAIGRRRSARTST